MDLGILNLNGYFVAVIVGLCLCIGYVVKKWIKDVENKYIPTICCVSGILLSIWINWGTFTPSVLLSGAVSGLASTGLHQAFTRFIEKSEIKE